MNYVGRVAQKAGHDAEKRLLGILYSINCYTARMSTPKEDYGKKTDIVLWLSHDEIKRIQVSMKRKSNRELDSLNKKSIYNIVVNPEITDEEIIRQLYRIVM